MKKLSLIAGLACLATVGGVFGAWTFSTAVSPDSTAGQNASLTVDTVVEKSGSITIDDESVTGDTTLYYSQDKSVGNLNGTQVTVTGNDYEFSFTDNTNYGSKTATYAAYVSVSVTGNLANYVENSVDVEITGATIVDGDVTITNAQLAALDIFDNTKIDITDADKAQTFVNAFAGSALTITLTIKSTTVFDA